MRQHNPDTKIIKDITRKQNYKHRPVLVMRTDAKILGKKTENGI